MPTRDPRPIRPARVRRTRLVPRIRGRAAALPPALARGPAAAATTAAPAPTLRDVDPFHFHPVFRDRLAAVVRTLESEGIPFRVFEGWRSPQRQQYLWDQGRTRPGAIVTKARAWESYHQYGIGADLVLFENGQWSWESGGERAAWWGRMQQVGREAGLEALSFELPHLQLAGLTISALRGGQYPAGADQCWAENLASAICQWSGTPDAPPRPAEVVERPPLDAAASAIAAGWAIQRTPCTKGWHSCFAGREWRVDAHGVYTRDGGARPLRTAGEPITMRRVWELFGDGLLETAGAHGLDPALLMMVIATETAAYRRYGFTGPVTFRWEPTVKVADVAPPLFGDYSAGPMQILATTARDIVRSHKMNYDPFALAPVFEYQPEPPPALPLYEAKASLEVGAAVIRDSWTKTEGDPILVAAAYNAGGVYKSAANPWHLRSWGNHLDRAAEWYGDACEVLGEAGR